MATNNQQRLYDIVPIPNKGTGVIAIQDIPKGTRIMAEKPLFIVPTDIMKRGNEVVEKHITQELKGLDKDQQRAFLSLHNCHGAKFSPFLAISKTNMLGLGSPPVGGGLFIEASRINHACNPNTQNSWNERISRETIHAVRDIKKGEEITISYIGHFASYDERQSILKDKFKFDCACEVCSLPPDQRMASDDRLATIHELDQAILSAGSNVKLGLGMVHKMLSLLETEGMYNSQVYRAYYDAFQMMAATDDKARAGELIRMALDHAKVVEGKDSETVKRFERLAADPTSHMAWGLYGRKRTQEMGPADKDSEAFKTWLWMK
ncbi:hypothetical protein QBC45DRAFT_72119 [Copromyces sp. CBS 386.78]|nr:hypothetical protein QBC45DRAFT_72119 [Copromyces sp. CBS 386.78]